jgi:hypothetical protein
MVPKKDPHSFEEDLGSGPRCNAPLVDNHDRHFGEGINNHKNKVIASLGGKKARHVVHQYGFPSHVGSR